MASGERFVFLLGDRAYYAHVADDGLLGADSLTHPTRAKAIRRGRPYYDEPSHFILDCYSDAALPPPTVPFDAHALIRSLATNAPLRRSRRATAANDGDESSSSGDVSTAAAASTPLPRIVSELLWNDAVSVSTLNSRLGGYKATALALEATVARLLCTLDGYETLIERLVTGDEQARTEARQLLDERAQRLARLLGGGANSIRSPSPPPSLQLDRLSLDALVGD